MNNIKKISKIELLKCLLGIHEYRLMYPEVKESHQYCIICGNIIRNRDFNENQYEYFRLIATLNDGIG